MVGCLTLLPKKKVSKNRNWKIRCLCGKVKETREHLFSCPMLDVQNNRAWETAMEKFKNDIDKETAEFKKKERGTFSRNKGKTQDVNKVLKFLSDFEDNTFGSSKKLLDFTLGLIQESDIKKLGRGMGSTRGMVKKQEPSWQNSVTGSGSTSESSLGKPDVR